MATKKTEIEEIVNEEMPEQDPWKIMRRIRLERARPGDEQDLFVRVNNRKFLIKKGMEVEVPLPVYYVLCKREDAQILQYNYDVAQQKLAEGL